MDTVMISLILLAVFFNTIAQLVLKLGMNQIGIFVFERANIFPIILKIMLCPWVVFGIIIYIGSLSVWLMVLSRVPVSVAYPMSSLGYVTSAIAAYYFLGEDLSIVRIIGIIIIMIGVFLVAKG